MSEERNKTHEPAQQHGIRGDDEQYLANMKEAIEREREKETAGRPNARALMEEQLADYERDKTDPPRRLNAGNLAAIFGISQAAVRRLIKEGKIETEPCRTEIIYYVRQSAIDRYSAQLAYHRGKRFIIVEKAYHPEDSQSFTLPDEIAAHVKNRIEDSSFVAYELDRVLTPDEVVSFIRQDIRVLSGAGFLDFTEARKNEERFAVWERCYKHDLSSTPPDLPDDIQANIKDVVRDPYYDVFEFNKPLSPDEVRLLRDELGFDVLPTHHFNDYYREKYAVWDDVKSEPEIPIASDIISSRSHTSTGGTKYEFTRILTPDEVRILEAFGFKTYPSIVFYKYYPEYPITIK